MTPSPFSAARRIRRSRATPAVLKARRSALVEIYFARLAVTPSQIRDLDLPTRPKKSDSRAGGFGEVSVELDAIHPDYLRALVAEAIERHLPRGHLEVLKVAEESERAVLFRWAEAAAGGGR